MRLVKCGKCGTAIMLDGYIEQEMFLAMQECNKKQDGQEISLTKIATFKKLHRLKK